MIPNGRQSIDQEDIAAVVDVLQSDWLTQGPMVTQFEQAIAEYCTAKHAIAVSNGTAALHLTCLALDIGQGDRVWTSPNSFVASANCALYCGAHVDFVDIDAKTYNLCSEALAKKLTQAKKTNTLPKLVIPVHFAGQSCAIAKIKQLADDYGFHIVEDASHAIGGRYQDKPIGCCEYSDAAIFSLHPVKIITTGEGGLVLTNQKKLAERIKRLATHGITRDNNLMQGSSHGPWYYQQIELGFNYRITDLQCALGLSQLKKLDQFVENRHELAAHYTEALSDLPITVPQQSHDCYSAFHLYVIQLKLDQLTKDRATIFQQLRDAGIGVNVHYIPIHTQPFYQRLGFKAGDFPQAEQYYQHALTLPLFPGLTKEQQSTVITQLYQIIQ